MLKRLPNWPELLAGKIDAARTSPFMWGKNDCCLFAAHCVEIITGSDLAGDYRSYKTKAEALRLLKKYGGVAGIAEAIAKEHGIRHTRLIFSDARWGEKLKPKLM